jgi:glycosyltransferase involved in cell wall biosynthesis
MASFGSFTSEQCSWRPLLNTHFKIAVVAVVRNEGPNIAEWIAYQSACGFDTIILFDNASTDDTVARALALRQRVDLRIHPWPTSDPNLQLNAYINAARSYEGEFYWLAFFDTDEFLVLDPGIHLCELLSLRSDSSAIAVPWAMFGSSGHRSRPTGLVIENYLHRSPNTFSPNRHIKTIARPERIIKFENPHMPAIDGKFSDLSGNTITFEKHGILEADSDYKIGKLHHYFTRSREDWLLKISRGYHGGSRDVSEFKDYDLINIYDDSAMNIAPLVRKILS